VKGEDSKLYLLVRDLLKSQKDLGDAREFLEVVKGRGYAGGDLYAFTRRGRSKSSRWIDSRRLRIYIHTQVGNRCMGAKVNGRMVPSGTS